MQELSASLQWKTPLISQLANEILERARDANVLQARVDLDNLLSRRAQRKSSRHEVSQFSRVNLKDLQALSFGDYQVLLRVTFRTKPNEMVMRNYKLMDCIYSRRRQTTVDQVSSYISQGGNDPSTGYYNTCWSCAKILGTCARMTSMLWYLGYARHQAKLT